MPDISLCKNYSCPINGKCYRFTAIPNAFRQSYGIFEYKDNECDYFLKKI